MAACTTQPTGTPGDSLGRLLLSPAESRVQLSIPAGEAQDALTLRVTTVNPLNQVWAIGLSLKLVDGRSTFITSISPYPIDDQPRSFTVPLPGPVREALVGGSGVLIAELQSADGQALREPLTVAVGAGWAEPR